MTNKQRIGLRERWDSYKEGTTQTEGPTEGPTDLSFFFYEGCYLDTTDENLKKSVGHNI